MQEENMTPTHKVLDNVTTESIHNSGTVSDELQEKKWQLNLQGLKTVVRITLPG